MNFKPIKSFSLLVSGMFACFTDPVSKVERTSYPAPTAGSMEYLISRIYGHPCIRYRIDKIHILNPLKYYPIYVNERGELGNVDMNTGDVKCVEYSHALQRMITFLKDVKYVVEFTMFYDKDFYRRNGRTYKAGENAAKHIDILERRISKGQSEYLPCFGLSECVADFGPAPSDFQACQDINIMYNALYKIPHIDDYTSTTAFSKVEIKKGVIDFSNSRIVVGNKVYSQDEFLNIEWGV
jgi:CRISPR-associated protein Cas5d